MAEKETTRIEIFSDGVFAIAATLLILEIKVPRPSEVLSADELWHHLANLWPSYFAFALSFGSILVMWVNHHNSFKLLRTTSRAFIYANGMLLMVVTFIPFPTALLAEYIDTPSASAAVTFYNGAFILTNIGFNLFWETMKRPVYLLKPEITPEIIRRINRNTRSGFFIYLTATIISFWLPVVGLILNSLLWVLWVTLLLGEKIEGVNNN